MKKLMGRWSFRAGIINLALCAILAGCKSGSDGSQPARADKFNLEIIPDASIKGQDVEVDLIPIPNPQVYNQFMSVSVSEYFSPGSPARKAAFVKTFRLGDTTQLISIKDPVWKNEWRNVPRLVIMAKLRGEFPAGANPNDPRRIVVALDRKKWETQKDTLKIQVTSQRVYPLNTEKVK